VRSAYTLVVLTLWPMSLCILHADDTRKGGWSAQASSGPSSADCTAVGSDSGNRYLSFLRQHQHRNTAGRWLEADATSFPSSPPTASTHQPSTHSALSAPRDSSFHQNTICPDATQTPLPNTARSCSPRRKHTPIWSIFPSYRAQLFYQHSPAHPWP
jgi:hypothetical protein